MVRLVTAGDRNTARGRRRVNLHGVMVIAVAVSVVNGSGRGGRRSGRGVTAGHHVTAAAAAASVVRTVL